MKLLRVFNDVLRFVLELVLLGVLGWFGWWVGGSAAVSVVLAVVIVAVVVVTWALFAAPKRRVATPGWVPGAMFLGYAVLAAAALAIGGHAKAGLLLVVVAVANEGMRLAGLQLVFDPEPGR